jgi:hypothetical protein
MIGAPIFRYALTPGWAGDRLTRAAQAVPSLDLNFAVTKNVGPLVSFTRASTATYIDSAGTLRSAVTNLLLRSEEFDNASWTKTQLNAFGSGSTANAIAAPNGTITADLITENTATAAHRVSQDTISGAIALGIYTTTVYFKSKERTRCYLNYTDNATGEVTATFNLSNQSSSVTTGGSWTGSTATVQSIGDGWFRCSLTSTKGNASFALSLRVGIADNSSNTSYTGDGTSGIYLWGAQLEQASTVGEYIPTTSTINSAPRFDHNPTTGESLGLLVEEQRTNLLLNTATLSTQSVTVTAAAHTLSFYGSGTVTLSGASTAGPAVGGGAFPARTTLTFTPSAGTLTLTVTGSVTSAQLEVGASPPTSYIPTTTAAATRAADVASITGTNFSSWYRQDEGTIYGEYIITVATSDGTLTSFDDGTANNRWQQRFTSIGQRYRLQSGGVSLVDDISTSAPLINATNKVAHAIRAGDQRHAGNGLLNAIALIASPLPTVTQLQIATGPGAGNAGRITIRRLTYWPTRLPDSTLQAITQ